MTTAMRAISTILMVKVWQEGIKTYISDIRYIQPLFLHSLSSDPVVWQMNKGSTDFLAARINFSLLVLVLPSV
jgi:hypothetical protein